MNGLALKIFWKGVDGNYQTGWAVLDKEQTISIERSSPIFNENGAFSYPFEIPYKENKYIFGDLDAPESDRKIRKGEYSFELYSYGVLLFTGDLDVDEGEIGDNIGIQLRSKGNSFYEQADSLNCRDVKQAEQVAVSKYEMFESGTQGHGIRLVTVSNISLEYPKANFCNTRVICNPLEDKEVIIEPDSTYAGICFYVMYFIKCLCNMFNFVVTENDMYEYEDFKRLAFFSTRRHVSTGYEAQYATSQNFPDVNVKDVINDLKYAFGIVFIYDEFSSRAKIKLLKNIFTSHKIKKISSNIISVSQLNKVNKPIIIKYDADEENTSFNYHDFKNVIEISDYNKIVDLYNKIESQKDNISCYIDRRTGNAYRIKVDSETYDNPAIFEVGQFNSYASQETTEDEAEEFVIKFNPIVLNDITDEDVRKKYDYKIENAIYVDFTLSVKSGPDRPRRHYYLPDSSNPSRREGQKPAFAVTRDVITDRPSRPPYGRPGTEQYIYNYDDIHKVDTGYQLGIMRGPGSDEKIDPTIDTYKDEIGGNSFAKLAGSMAFTSDSIDVFGRDYDYNGAAGGSGGDPLNKRISLKLTAEKPGYKASSYPQRGLVDMFLKEYIYFMTNKKTIKIMVDMTLTELVSIDWECRYHIGEYSGFINKISYEINISTGVSFTEIELYMI